MLHHPPKKRKTKQGVKRRKVNNSKLSGGCAMVFPKPHLSTQISTEIRCIILHPCNPQDQEGQDFRFSERWVYVSCQTHPFSTSMIFARKSSFKDFWFLRSCQFPISPKREELKVWSVAVAGWYLRWLLVLVSPSASKPMGWPRTHRRRLDDLTMSLFAKHLRMLDPNWPKNILERMEKLVRSTEESSRKWQG